MKTRAYIIILLNAITLLCSLSLQAQWTENTNYVYMTSGAKKLGIGTTSPSYKLDIKDSSNTSFRIQSTLNGSANLILSRSLTTTNCLVNYKTGATDVWFTGCKATNNFIINNAANVTTFSILQSNGNVGIGIALPVFKLDVKGGSINTDSAYYLAGNKILSTKGISNTFVGVNVGYNNTTGYGNSAIATSALAANTTGHSNTANGAFALSANVSGSFNTALGFEALKVNGTGNNNTAIGADALSYNTTGYANTACGYIALNFNTSGNNNTAFGNSTLSLSTTGNNNTALGSNALYANTTGYYNTSNGSNTLSSNTTGYANTAIGYNALNNNITGFRNTANGYSAGDYNDANSNCTYFGYDADQVVLTDYINSTAAGNSTRITGSNQVRLGNSSITSIGGFVNWTNVSDGRYKKDIKENVPGLEFINQLTPVTYHLDVTGISTFLGEDITGLEGKPGFIDRIPEEKLSIEKDRKAKEEIVYSGFIAQDVERAADKLGYNFSGVDVPQNENSLYGLRYAEFVVPLVKAVQELDEKNKQLAISNEQLKNENQKQQLAIGSLQSTVGNLQNEIANMRSCLETFCNASEMKSISNAQDSPVGSQGALYQNNPNPFKENTTIGFYISSSSSKAMLKIFSMNGEELKSFVISTKGKGRIEIAGNTLAPGVYTYVLIVDDRTVDTKQMVITR